jgi:hypothetical protein
MVAIVMDESKWLTASMVLAALATGWLVRRHRAPAGGARSLIAAAMNLFFAVTIGTMAFGHLFVVTIKLLQGTLEGSRVVLYAIGVALAIPSWWLIRHAPRLADSTSAGPKAIALNAWLGVTLLFLGLHNLPLALPAALNIGYLGHARPLAGRVMLAAAVLINAGLFVGSLIFLASGRSFEEFSG